MKHLLILAVMVLSAFAAKVFAQGAISTGELTVRDLATTSRDAQYPVCFNGAGELLPCNSLVEPPPPPGEPQTLDGLWVGTMLADGPTSGAYDCHDADVFINITNYSWVTLSDYSRHSAPPSP